MGKGGKGGGWAGNTSKLTAAQREFVDEEAMNYEVGLKSYLLDHIMQLNMALFRAAYDVVTQSGDGNILRDSIQPFLMAPRTIGLTASYRY